MNNQQAILERIHKNRFNKEEIVENEILAEQYTSSLKTQFQDDDMQNLHNRLMEGKADIKLLELSKKTMRERLIPFDTEIKDLEREAGYLERIGNYLNNLFVNLESVDNLISHADRELEDIKDRIVILDYERQQIINGEV